MKKIIIWMFVLGFFGCDNSKSQPNKIPLEKIEEMFSSMKTNGVNTDTIMLWGYFFTSNKKDNFSSLIKELESKNFNFVKTFQAEDKKYWLHLERKEVHNTKSLFALDEEFYEIAEKYKVIYDGFDVGNVDKSKPIERNTYIVPEEFKVVNYQKDGLPCLLLGNTGFDIFPHKEEFCYVIKITTLYKKDGQFLLPTEKEIDDLDDFELIVENNLTQNKIKKYYVFRETHKGVRTFFIVTNDKEGAAKVVEFIKNSKKQRLFDFKIITDKKWNFYNEFRKNIK